MDWLKDIFPFNIKIQRKTLVRFKKLDSYELEICKPKIIRRERPFFQKDKLDVYHLQKDGNIKQTPID